jgi:hypothetical protein
MENFLARRVRNDEARHKPRVEAIARDRHSCFTIHAGWEAWGDADVPQNGVALKAP